MEILNSLHPGKTQTQQIIFLRARTAHISHGNSVLVSVHLSRLRTNQSPCKLETSGFHHMTAQSL